MFEAASRSPGAPGAPATREARLAALVALAAAAVVGVAVAGRPLEVMAAVALAAVGVAVLATLPTRGLVAVAVAGVGVVPIVMEEAAARGISLGLTPFEGQARFVAALLVVAIVLVAVRREQVTLNRFALVLVLAYAGGLALEAVVSYVRGSEYPGLMGDLARQTTYACAFFVGAIASAAVPTLRSRIRVYDILAAIVVLFSASALVYWAWATGRLTALPAPVVHVFEHALAATGSQFGEGRSIFPFVDQSPNASSISFALLAALVVPPLALARSNWRRLLACAVLVGAGGAILATESREGVVAAIAALAPILLAMRRLPRKVVVGAVVAAVAIVAGAAALFPAERGLSLNTETLRAREHIWSQALGRYGEAPIFGHGFNFSAQPRFVEKLPNTVYDIGAPMARLAPIHNEYLGRLLDGGVVGVAILAFVLGGMFLAGRRLLDGGPVLRAEGIGLLAATCVLVVSMLASSSFDTAGIAVIFWLIVGWIVGAVGARDAPT